MPAIIQNSKVSFPFSSLGCWYFCLLSHFNSWVSLLFYYWIQVDNWSTGWRCSRVSNSLSVFLAGLWWKPVLDLLDFRDVGVQPVTVWNSLNLVAPVLVSDGDLLLWDLEPVLKVWISVQVTLPATFQFVDIISDHHGVGSSEQSNHRNKLHF